MKKNHIIINVLAPEYYEDCHIDGSINVPVNELEQYATRLDKKQPITVYCAHYQCHASNKAFEILKKLGFENITAYEGGMREWFQLGLPTKGACKKDYLHEANEAQPAEDDLIIITAEELKKKL